MLKSIKILRSRGGVVALMNRLPPPPRTPPTEWNGIKITRTHAVIVARARENPGERWGIGGENAQVQKRGVKKTEVQDLSL